MLKRFLVPEKDQVLVTEAAARAATQSIFEKMGMSEEDAVIATDVLITSDLRGCESHGVSNMLRNYVAMYQADRMNPRPEVKTLRETPVSATWDADTGLGIQVGPKAMKLAIEKAEKFGMGAVSVRNTGHLAGCGYYPLQATEKDMIGHAFTGSPGQQTLPTWGSEPILGTNPVAWAAPANDMPAFLFDIATSQVAGNKIELT